MKPAKLKPLIGRTVAVYWNGFRTGTVVGIPASDTVSVQLLGTHGRRRIDLDKVQHVYWYKVKRTVEEYLALVAKKEEAK